MSWAAVGITAGTWLVSETVKGIGAEQSSEDIEAAKAAAEGMYSTTLGQIEQKTALETGNIMDTWMTGRGTAEAAGEAKIEDVFGKIAGTKAQTGMAGVGEIIGAEEKATTDVTKAFTDQMQTLTDTKNYSVATTKLAGETSKTQAEEKYEKMLAELDAMPDTFLEGFMGGIFA